MKGDAVAALKLVHGSLERQESGMAGQRVFEIVGYLVPLGEQQVQALLPLPPGQMLVLEVNDRRPRARDVEQLDDFVVVALSIDLEQIYPLDAMFRDQAGRVDGSDRQLFDDDGLGRLEGIGAKHIGID